MYENLLSLPYFQGMSKDDITAILDKVKLEFTNYSDKETVCRQGEECNRFLILTKGEITAATTSPCGTYSIEEDIRAPYAIEPYSLFGYSTTYKRTYTSNEGCTILAIEKGYFFSEFAKQHIFTLNLINLISRKVQVQNETTWKHTPASIEGRIALFIAQRSENTTGYRRVKIKMEQLAAIICETRLNVSKALNSLQERGLVSLSRKEIHIPDFSKLIPLIK